MCNSEIEQDAVTKTLFLNTHTQSLFLTYTQGYLETVQIQNLSLSVFTKLELC